MGDWLKKYGDAVYGTRGGPFKPGTWGVSTCRKDRIYLFVMNWNEDNMLVLPQIPLAIKDAKVMSGGKIEWTQTQEGITLALPKEDHDKIVTVIELQVAGRAFDIPPMDIVKKISG
jgi:alpha-L-fucosidase